ncbi:hypothetical protein EVAR_70587_1 [Eumeta japonica]|uniref:Lipase domain-containing protein n=1 Tax=Eumeta variegata TaxID=151549 RepID=A0A4C1SI89_EUMVA|nr:hypothetical protein EVAR_70587_1 [Eumeta japonica]
MKQRLLQLNLFLSEWKDLSLLYLSLALRRANHASGRDACLSLALIRVTANEAVILFVCLPFRVASDCSARPSIMLYYVNFTFFVLFISGARAFGRGDLEKYGPLELALRSSLIKCDHDKTLNLDVNGISVYFYDFENRNNFVYDIDEAGSQISNIYGLNKNRKFILFVPGYKTNINKKTVEIVRDAFQNLPNSYLIIIDHNLYTNNDHGFIKSYERAVKYVYYIGRALADMVTTITQNGVSPKNFHCIGHSLGAQMLGQTGDLFIKNTGQKLARITGLDPAGPCFSNSLIEEQIRSGVADYVEIYHCNAGALGTTSVLGDVDFFANKKGSSQPDCGTPLIPGIFDSSKAATCNHRTCIELYLATVTHPDWFPATACNSYKQYKEGGCSSNDMTIAGFWNPGTAKGVYYFSTKDYDIDVN